VAVSVLVPVLLVVAVLGVAVSAAGVLVARDAVDRLHYLGPATVVGGGGVLLAVLAEEGASLVTARVTVIVVLLVVVGPVLGHATARAGLVRGDVERLRDEDPRLVEP
jgi:multicomponent Na+:H+ antiporter subunit G